MYYGARWYDSETGRFISEDPAAATPEDPLSINRYVYCRNNPLIYTDPTGMITWQEIGQNLCDQLTGTYWFKHPKEAAIAIGIGTALLTGGATAGWVGGAWGAAAGVLVGGIAGNYAAGFSAAVMSGGDFDQATHAGSTSVTQSNYVLTFIMAGVAYFTYVPKTAGAPKPEGNSSQGNGNPQTVDQTDVKIKGFWDKITDAVKETFNDPEYQEYGRNWTTDYLGGKVGDKALSYSVKVATKKIAGKILKGSLKKTIPIYGQVSFGLEVVQWSRLGGETLKYVVRHYND